MAVINTQDSYAKMEFPLTIKRQDAFSMDPTEIWPSLEAAQEYARSNPTAYVGQEFDTVNGDLFVKVYIPPVKEEPQKKGNKNKAQSKVTKLKTRTY